MSDRAEYIRCRNCGQYRLSEDMYHGFYCSRECSEKYAQCKNCGAFFLSLDPSTDEFCSEECETSWHTPRVHIPHSHTDEEGVII